MSVRKYHRDAGYGWVAVPLDELEKLGITDKITAYSYVDHCDGVAYLEEDCDVATYMLAHDDRHEDRPELLEIYDGADSPIRNLPHYKSSDFERALFGMIGSQQSAD